MGTKWLGQTECLAAVSCSFRSCNMAATTPAVVSLVLLLLLLLSRCWVMSTCLMLHP
jgi:hypothetical protein